MPSADCGADIAKIVAEAGCTGRHLRICGSGSKKDWLHPPASAEMLSLTEHTGIVNYDPAELVVTVRAGTELRELTRVLQQEGQALACDPPSFFGTGTVGGLVAAGFSGPGRPWGGSVRDAVLGVEMVNGLGERLTFGGQVMKNVAGYDVSRLMAGSWGEIGVLLSVSLRVHPVASHVTTCVLETSATAALELGAQFARQALPIAATWWHDGRLHVRLAGSEAALRSGRAIIGGEKHRDENYWDEIRDHRHPFFRSNIDLPDHALWRIVVPPACELPNLGIDESAADLAMEWRGGLRWLWHSEPQRVMESARAVGGWAWSRGTPQPVQGAQLTLMRQIKAAFDPKGVFVSGLSMVAA